MSAHVCKQNPLKLTNVQVCIWIFALYICMRRLLAVHPAERHTAAGAGAGEPCDAARCFPAASGDAAPRG